jgi:hypothetical protein
VVDRDRFLRSENTSERRLYLLSLRLKLIQRVKATNEERKCSKLEGGSDSGRDIDLRSFV